jgi:hypothetical protein
MNRHHLYDPSHCFYSPLFRSHEPHGFGTSTDPEEESHQLSSLPDILNLVKLYPSKQLLIEIKGDKQSAPLIHRDIIQNGANPAQVHIIGFCFDTMIDLKQLLPSFSSILICRQKSSEDALLWIDKASDAELDGIDFLADHNTVTSEVVTKAHKLNLKVLVYVGKEFDIETSWDALLSAEVDVFTSDLPPAVYPWMTRQEALRDCTNTKTCHVVDVPKTPYSPLSVSTPKRDITGTLLSHPTSVMSPRLAAADEVGLVDMIKEGVVESVIDDGLLKSPKMIKVES